MNLRTVSHPILQLEKPLLISALPSEQVHYPHRPSSMFLAIFLGVACSSLIGLALWGGLVADKPIIDLWPLLLLLIFSAVLLKVVIDFHSRYQKITLSRDQIHFFTGNASHHVTWQEPLKHYESVLVRAITPLDANYNPAHYEALTLVELKHPNAERCLPLYTTKDHQAARQYWLDASRILGIPAIEIAS